MKSRWMFVAAALCASSSFAQGYYATKADARAGRLTPGPAPVVTDSHPGIEAGTNACPGTAIADPGTGNTYNDSGTTVGADSTVHAVQAGCSNYTTVNGPDVIYQFDLGPLGSRGATLTILVTPTGATGYDPAIFTLSTAGPGCPAGTLNAVTNCVNGADAGLANVAETISDAETDLMPAGHYFLFVDSFYLAGSAGNPNRHNGPYDLAFGVGALPVELLGFEVD